MRTYPVAVVVAIIVITIGAKLVFFPPIKAEADVPAMNVFQMHANHPDIKNMPIQKIDDMSVVFN